MHDKDNNGRGPYALRPDLYHALMQSRIDPCQLSAFQRIILTADGTLTPILEAYLFETIQVVKLSENVISPTADIPPLNIKAGTEVIERNILLQGKISRNNWLYATSLLVPDRLDEKFRERLLESREPMGKLWLEHRLETFKEIIAAEREPAGELSASFGIDKEDRLLSRTYRVFSNQKPIMMITEKFPECFFTENSP